MAGDYPFALMFGCEVMKTHLEWERAEYERRRYEAQVARSQIEAQAGLYRAVHGVALKRRTHCIGCGAPQEPVCSYCLTPEAP